MPDGQVTIDSGSGKPQKLTPSQLRTIAQRAQKLHSEDGLDKEDALDEAFRQVRLGKK